MTIGERPNKKNIELTNLTRKVNILRLWRGNDKSWPAAIKTDILQIRNIIISHRKKDIMTKFQIYEALVLVIDKVNFLLGKIFCISPTLKSLL